MTRFKRSDIAQIALLVLLFGVLYNHTIVKLVGDWSRDPNFSHGFLIPFISGFMIWQKHDLLPYGAIRPSGWGLAVLCMGMGMHILGNVGAELFVMRVSIVVSLCGIALYFLGWPFTREIAVPLLYLLIMIPIPSIIWNKIAFPLQGFAATLTADVVRGIGIPILQEGNVLHLPNTSLEVVDACSGIRSLTSLLALSGAFAYIGSLALPGKWILFLSAIPIAILVNIVRLTATAMMAIYIGAEAAQGFLHEASGVVVFVVAFASVYAVSQLLERIEARFEGRGA